MAKIHKTHLLPVQQLLILSVCRFAEPIALTSVFPYLPEMMESFGVPKEAVSKWAGTTSAVFSLSQALTGIAWGRASDRFGRKPAILLAMIGTMAASLLFGFANSLTWAIVARSLGGASSGMVGIMRTTVAEMVPYKPLQPRAFSIMPLVWTVGSIFGPGFGGALANPAVKYPQVFGGSAFFQTYPFALPNLVASVIFLFGLAVGFLFLRESLETKKNNKDYGRALGQALLRPFRKRNAKSKCSNDAEQRSSLLRNSHKASYGSIGEVDSQGNRKIKHLIAPTYREIFTRQSNLNLVSYTVLALHSQAYDQLLPIFMHYPPQTERSSNPDVRLPFKFSGGFGIDSDRIGLLFTIYGIAGMFIQFFIFPPVARHYGALRCLKASTVIFPIAYLITPFTALCPTALSQQIAIFIVMMLKCWAVIFAFPCTTILMTNSATSLQILGTLNGVATSTSAIGRAAGPAIGGWTFSIGAREGFGILPWWILGAFALLGAFTPYLLIETDGFGGSGDESDDDEANEDELPSSVDGQNRAQPVYIGGGPLAEDREGDDLFATEHNPLAGSQCLSKSTSNNGRA